LIRAMGAYFIRRKSRNELYRKVLARYVGLATDAGVTQAVFPEGGLSLSGALMPPKLGLLKYIIDGFDSEVGDVVFVPVALNYDRVLEDQILTTAANDPEHRFKARIGVIAGKTIKQICLRLIGRYHKFGYAAVSTGEPLSLRDFSQGQGGCDLTVPLAEALIKRIGAVVPVLPVPVLSSLVLNNAPMNHAELEHAFDVMIDVLPAANVRIPRHDKENSIKFGLRHMVARGLVTENDGRYTLNPNKREILQFYANSIQHLMPQSDGREV
jgi:glycerol-3-phosphate O-acyltransferase